ncbi:MAG: hypothetical protein GY770_09210 [Aestuariibacter sp.]|nr:hypothetical protein [Aestuariibacter sp.]
MSISLIKKTLGLWLGLIAIIPFYCIASDAPLFVYDADKVIRLQDRLNTLTKTNRDRLFEHMRMGQTKTHLRWENLEKGDEQFNTYGEKLFSLMTIGKKPNPIVFYTMFHVVSEYIQKRFPASDPTVIGEQIKHLSKKIESNLNSIPSGRDQYSYLLNPILWGLEDASLAEIEWMPSLMNLFEYASIRFYGEKSVETIVIQDHTPQGVALRKRFQNILQATKAFEPATGINIAPEALEAAELTTLMMQLFLVETESNEFRRLLLSDISKRGLAKGLLQPLIKLAGDFNSLEEPELLNNTLSIIHPINEKLATELNTLYSGSAPLERTETFSKASYPERGITILKKLIQRGERLLQLSPKEWGYSELYFNGYLKDYTLQQRKPAHLAVTTNAATLKERAHHAYDRMNLTLPKPFGAQTVYNRLDAFTQRGNYYVPGSARLPHVTRLVAPYTPRGWAGIPPARWSPKPQNILGALRHLAFTQVLLPFMGKLEREMQQDLQTQMWDLQPGETGHFFGRIDGTSFNGFRRYDPTQSNLFAQGTLFRSVTRPSTEFTNTIERLDRNYQRQSIENASIQFERERVQGETNLQETRRNQEAELSVSLRRSQTERNTRQQNEIQALQQRRSQLQQRESNNRKAPPREINESPQQQRQSAEQQERLLHQENRQQMQEARREIREIQQMQRAEKRREAALLKAQAAQQHADQQAAKTAQEAAQQAERDRERARDEADAARRAKKQQKDEADERERIRLQHEEEQNEREEEEEGATLKHDLAKPVNPDYLELQSQPNISAQEAQRLMIIRYMSEVYPINPDYTEENDPAAVGAGKPTPRMVYIWSVDPPREWFEEGEIPGFSTRQSIEALPDPQIGWTDPMNPDFIELNLPPGPTGIITPPGIEVMDFLNSSPFNESP